ncbi:MAG: YfcE family phosphodiesterase [Cereibacter sphaeroides]|uniref:YfcE family phosphodiesterase n=1 Tax=Cereibacter sphaeroides TaxID=1063 RepID=A0A2W5TQ50_CERSP|nr:MAG: YfcE family phosphodiesterase [Cereibacter sphaeroides]
MRLAVLADIHGNIDALRAVAQDLKTQSPDLTVNLGDCLSGPLWPAETADYLIAANWPTVRGNHDRWLTSPLDPPGPWEIDTLPHLAPAHHTWLASLPPTLSVEGAFLCHATPQDDTTYWLHHVRPDGTFASSPRARIAELAGDRPERLLLCGHTHLAAAACLPDGRLVLNPGSVGAPGYEDDHPVYHRVEAGTPHASYAILDQKGDDWSVTFRRIPYDTGPAIARAADQRDWASALASGWLPEV